jgi:dTMP kinase
MNKNTYLGKFIVFEGLDGSGQSTQSELLFEFLKEKSQIRRFGHTGVHLTKEPTASLIGGLIRGQLNKDWASNPETLQLLFAADRLHHLEKEVVPLLERGITVVCDRYFYSSVAYGAAEIGDEKWLTQINSKVLEPDMVFLLKVSPKVCIQRIAANRHGFTLFERIEKLEQVWKNYSKLAHRYKNLKMIDGEKSVDKIAHNIQKFVLEEL